MGTRRVRFPCVMGRGHGCRAFFRWCFSVWVHSWVDSCRYITSEVWGTREGVLWSSGREDLIAY